MNSVTPASRYLVDRCVGCGCKHHDPLHSKEGFDLVRCQSCGLVFVKNPPSAEELATFYSFATGYHSPKSETDLGDAARQGVAKKNLAALRRVAPPCRLLDVGCSTGAFLKLAIDAGWDAMGVEFSADAAAAARARGLRVVHGDITAVASLNERFDVVTMWDVLEHVPQPDRCIHAASALLVEGGLLIVKTPNVDGLFPKLSLAACRWTGYWPHPEPPGHLFQFAPSTLIPMLESAGFAIRSVSHAHIPLQYSFGRLRNWFRSVRWFLFVVTFAPIARVGPMLRLGDDFTVVARKVGERGHTSA